MAHERSKSLARRVAAILTRSGASKAGRGVTGFRALPRDWAPGGVDVVEVDDEGYRSWNQDALVTYHAILVRGGFNAQLRYLRGGPFDLFVPLTS